MQKKDNNRHFIKINSTVLTPITRICKPSFSAATQESTAGSEKDWVERSEGLADASFSITMLYDIDQAVALAQLLRPNARVVFEWGQDGNVAGKPRHVQNCMVGSFTPGEVRHDKRLVEIQVELQGDGEPSVNMLAGGTY